LQGCNNLTWERGVAVYKHNQSVTWEAMDAGGVAVGSENIV